MFSLARLVKLRAKLRKSCRGLLFEVVDTERVGMRALAVETFL